ncbi:MAG: GAF domain-containing protein [Elusimicrobia bacterium]|nr:GAF domain-containing protein [Elusimicrobiota bacterium]
MRRSLLQLVHELTQRALAPGEAQGFWKFLAERLIEYFGCERATIFQRDAKDRLVSRYAHGLKEPLVIPPGEGISGWVAECCKPHLANDVYEDPLFNPQIDQTTRFRTKSLLAFPLPYKGRAAGVVELINKPGGFSKSDMRAVKFFGDELAVLFVKFRFEERQEQMTRQLVQNEKMAAMGRLASGIAHELNNPLATVMGFSQLLLRDSRTPPEIMATILKIDAEARRMREIVRSILTFARASTEQAEPVRLSAVIDASLELLTHERRRRGVNIIKEIPTPEPVVLGDANNLKQVYLNLIGNALHALEGQPDRRIILRVFRDPKRQAAVSEVEDNGPGIPEKILEHIFEPFFTTKEEGKGTGLGLYVVSGIVEKHKGFITVTSRPGCTVFRVSLPAAKSSEPSPPAKP